MSPKRKPTPRAERRAEARARLKTQPLKAAPRLNMSPMTRLSLAAGAVGVVLVVILVLARGGAGAVPSGIVPAPIAVPSGLANGRALGNANAPVTIDIWADFQCPVCKEFYDEVEPQLRSTYVKAGTVLFVFHDFAFIGQESIQAAAAARVSQAIGPGFWQFHDLLYTNQGAENGGSFSQDRLAEMAVSLGMDRTAFLTALADSSYTSAVTQETAQGSQFGVTSTPTLSINGTIHAGLPTFAQLSAAIDAITGAQSPSPSP